MIFKGTRLAVERKIVGRKIRKSSFSLSFHFKIAYTLCKLFVFNNLLYLKIFTYTFTGIFSVSERVNKYFKSISNLNDIY